MQQETLPNIAGAVDTFSSNGGGTNGVPLRIFQKPSGGFYTNKSSIYGIGYKPEGTNGMYLANLSGCTFTGSVLGFSAANSNKIYKSNANVRPNNLSIKVWKRIN